MRQEDERKWRTSFDCPCENEGCGKTPCHAMFDNKTLCDECAREYQDVLTNQHNVPENDE